MEYKNVYVDGVMSDITVEDNVISAITPSVAPASNDLRGKRMALPGFANLHTHSAMTLLRSAGSGLPLFRWLTETIFPREAELTADDIYRGAKDACDEMRETGTTAFNDMYFMIENTVRAAAERGIKGNVAMSVTDRDFEQGDVVKRYMKSIEQCMTKSSTANGNQNSKIPGALTTSISPHAIYTVSGKNLQYLADFAAEHDTLYHIHLSETRKEREDCIREHGVPPLVYLEQLGVLDKVGNRFVGAHALWLDADEIKLLGAHGATVVHCPNSNLKLGSGYEFHYVELRDAGVNVTLGTDGCASSDNLDMIEAMKVMSLLQKGTRHDPSVLPAEEVLQVATHNGRKALRLPDNAIRVGNVADFSLFGLDDRIFKGVDFVRQSAAELHSTLLNRLIYAGGGRMRILNFES